MRQARHAACIMSCNVLVSSFGVVYVALLYLNICVVSMRQAHHAACIMSCNSLVLFGVVCVTLLSGNGVLYAQ